MAKPDVPAIKRTPKPKAPAEPRIDKLDRLVRLIEERNHHSHRPALYEDLEREGMKVRELDEATHISLAGIKGQSTAGKAIALNNWCEAARRELLELRNA